MRLLISQYANRHSIFDFDDLPATMVTTLHNRSLDGGWGHRSSNKLRGA